MASQTLLDVLRSRTAVDCDTLDASVAAELGPFVDCTSNQAIACSELQEDRHKDLLKKAATLAKDASPKYPGVKLETLAVEIAMILLALQVYPHLTGFVHIQANPFDAYNTAATVAGARRIVSLFKDVVDPAFDTTRICIKIASTWEGLQACRQLEAEHNIRTLATTLFTLEQAALAAEVGCRYIAPYVNELRVHFDKSYTDPSPNLPLCATIQRYYTAHSLPTQVLPASLTSAAECMQLAGVHHITVAPALLRELAATKTGDDTPAAKAHSLFDDASAKHAPVPPKLSYVGDEAGWRMALTRANKGREEGKLVYAINTFCDMQIALEKALKAEIAAL